MTDFATHARDLPGQLSDLTRSLLEEIHVQTHEAALQLAQAKTPRRTGRTASQWQSAPAATGRLQPSKVRNTAPAVSVLSGGRRRSQNAWTVRRGGKTHTVKPGKMLGSTQAPFGIKGPVLRELGQREDAIFERAAAAVEGRVR